MIQTTNPGTGIDKLGQQNPEHRPLNLDSPNRSLTTAQARAVSDAEATQFEDGYSREFADHPGILMRIGLTLLRGVLIALFFILFEIITYAILAIAILQYLVIVLAGRPLGLLQRLSEGLAAYMGDIAGYLTCVDDRAPFPFSRLRGARGIPLQPQWRRPKTADDEGADSWA